MQGGSFKDSYKQTLRENTGLAVTNTGRQHCEAGYCWGPGVREHYVLHIIEGGQGSYTVDGQHHQLSAGSLFLLPPRTVVTYQADVQNPWAYDWVGFQGADAPRLLALCALGSDALAVGLGEHAPQLSALLRAVHEARGTTPAHDMAMTGQLYLFFSHLAKALHPAVPSPSFNRDVMQTAMRLIAYSHAQPMGVAELADAIGLSRSQLYRIFIKETGLAPNALITQYRVNRACSLLRAQQLTVAQVAASVGFTDALHFSRVFKRLKGVSPSHFAQQAADQQAEKPSLNP